MDKSYIKFCNLAIFLIIAATVGLIPLFFLTATASFFEFNKFAVLIAAVIAGYLIWALRLVLEKKFRFVHSPLDLPILAFAAVSLISSLTSLDRFVSLAGAYGKPWPSFFAIAAVSAFYFLATSNIKTPKQLEQILLVLIGSSAIASLIALASYFGVYFPFDFAKFHSFNTAGSPIGLALLQAIVIPLAVYWVISAKDRILFIVGAAAALVMIFSLILINFLPAYLGPVAAIIFSAGSMTKVKFTKAARSRLITILIVTFLFLALRHVPQISQNALAQWISAKPQNVSPREQIDTPKEFTLPHMAGWDIATQAIGKRPLLGTGPGTFAFAFTQFKPRYLNSTKLWPVAFDRSSSDFTEVLTTMGAAGTISYLILLAVSLRFIYVLVVKSQKPGPYLAVASAIISAVAVSFFVTGSLLTSAVFFFLLSALTVLANFADEKSVAEVNLEIASSQNKLNWLPLGGNLGTIRISEESRGSGKSQLLPLLFLTLAAAVGVWGIWNQFKAYRAEVLYRQAQAAISQNDGNKSLELLQKTIFASPEVDTYHRTLSQTALKIALNLSQKKDLSQDNQKLLKQLMQVAISQGQIASGYKIASQNAPGTSGQNVANWVALADVYQTLTGSAGGSDVHAVSTLIQAVNLDPQNVILHDRLGLLYQKLNKLDLAQKKFEDATIIKNDYGPAHYHLAKLLISTKGDSQKIQQELTLARGYLPKNDPLLGDINTKLDSYKNQDQVSPSTIPTATPF